MKKHSNKIFCATDNLFWKNKQIEDLPNEIWKDVIGYDGYYEISNLGRIKSLPRLRITPTGGEGYTKSKILSISVSRDSTPQAVFIVDGVKVRLTLWEQVALHFIPNYNKGDVVWFKDNNCLNPEINNLIILNKENYFNILNKNKSRFNNYVARYLFSIGKRRCTKCYQIKDINCMTNNKSKVKSMFKNHICNDCSAKYMRERREKKTVTTEDK
jgi:hypothetical protein